MLGAHLIDLSGTTQRYLLESVKYNSQFLNVSNRIGYNASQEIRKAIVKAFSLHFVKQASYEDYPQNQSYSSSFYRDPLSNVL